MPMNDVMSMRRTVLFLLTTAALALSACDEVTTDAGGKPVDPKAAVLAAMT